jgi:hypothetical protein
MLCYAEYCLITIDVKFYFYPLINKNNISNVWNVLLKIQQHKMSCKIYILLAEFTFSYIFCKYRWHLCLF